jgi:beta-1,4-mannosyltransferase
MAPPAKFGNRRMIVYIQHSKVPTHRTLHKVMAESGLKLRYFQFFFFPVRPGIVYIHFPEACFWTTSTWKMLVKFSVFMVSILSARLGGSRIVWEINNIRSHEQHFPLFEAILMAVLTRSVTGVIHNSNSSVREAIESYPALQRVPWTVIPQSNFHHIYPERGDAARGQRILGVDKGETVLLNFGLIRRYKGVDKLIEIFKQVESATLRLVIAGMPVEPVYADELQRAALSDARIRLIFRDIPHDEVPHIYATAALACAPFRAILNSGSVTLALSCDCPVIAPRLGTMPDLEERVGTDWIMLYDGELDLPILHRAIAWVRSPRLLPPALGFCDFGKVATDTLSFLTQISSA